MLCSSSLDSCPLYRPSDLAYGPRAAGRPRTRCTAGALITVRATPTEYRHGRDTHTRESKERDVC